MQKIILDANAILRYVLEDTGEQFEAVEAIMINSQVLILPEVIAEVIYVLTKYYKIHRKEAAEAVLQFLLDAGCYSRVLIGSVGKFGNSNFDFVDCLLYEYSKNSGHKVFTFDKKLLKLIEDEGVK